MQLQKKHGVDVFVDTENPIFHAAISTGSMMIDKDSGIGGIPEGKITEIYGEQLDYHYIKNEIIRLLI